MFEQLDPWAPIQPWVTCIKPELYLTHELVAEHMSSNNSPMIIEEYCGQILFAIHYLQLEYWHQPQKLY